MRLRTISIQFLTQILNKLNRLKADRDLGSRERLGEKGSSWNV